MKLIDDNGNLFGAVNIIDALVVLLVVAVVVSGVAFLVGQQPSQPTDDTPEPESRTVTLQVVGVQPYVADALAVGDVESGSVVAIENKSVAATTVVTEDEAGNLHEREHPQQRTVTMRVTLQTTEDENGSLVGETPLEVGRNVTLDFGNVTADATITAV